MADEHLIFAVSDSTGETAEQAANAALAQFGTNNAQVHIYGHVRDEEGLRKLIDSARENGALILYTLMEPELRVRMAAMTKETGVTAVDLLGSLIREMSRFLGVPALYMPGLGHETDEEYFRRIEAVEFAVYNDDGRLPENLVKADIVLVGISRTSKTPLSNYIAHRGYKVANMPLVDNQNPPKQLDDVDPRRVFALVVDPLVLANIRRARLDAMGAGADSSYGDLKHIREEMAWARRIFRDHPEWTVLDMTERAIEETASDILEAYRARFEHPPLPAAKKD